MSTETEMVRPPAAERKPVRTVLHGDERVDDYAWMREKADPAVAAYLDAENAYCDAVMAGTEELQESLYREMLGHIKETDVSVPYREGGYYHLHRTEEGEQYQIHCRKKGSLDAAEEVVLDVNSLAEGQPFMSLGAYAFSPDGRYVAYSKDPTGFRQYTLQVKVLETGETLADSAERVTTVAWASDNRTLFYTVEDETTKRSHRLYRHLLGGAEHELLYEEPDELFHMTVHRTRSGEYLVLQIDSHTTSEVRVLRADEPGGEWETIAPRRHEHEYDIDHRGDRFYIRTNDRGRNFRLVTAPVEGPAEDNWTEVVPHRDDVMLEGAACFAGQVVLSEREGGLTQFSIHREGRVDRVAFPEPAYTAMLASNREHETGTIRYVYESMVTPHSVFDYHIELGESELLKETEVPGYDRSRYVAERTWATSTDGTRVPVSLVRRRDTPVNGTAPGLLGGYGSYGYPYPASFNSNRLALLDRGFVVAVAHIRGGGEMGKAWHDQGRMKQKMNTFTDFIAAADFLVEEGYVSRDRLAIEGGSAGGLLMGGVANLRPDLCRAVISHVPFVDVLNTMLDATLPLTIGEYEEWGNPNVAEDYAYMRTYCPYTNVTEAAYPAMLVKTAFNDSQVMYWEPAKYVAKLRTLKRDGRALIFKTNMAAGHGGASGRYDYLREIALDYSFLLRELGAEEAE